MSRKMLTAIGTASLRAGPAQPVEVEDRERLASALGLPTLPVARFTVPTREAPGGRHQRRTWKLASVEAFVGDRPAAWIDDELHGDAYAWAALRTVPTKLLSPDPRGGILGRDVRALLAFARRTVGGAVRSS